LCLPDPGRQDAGGQPGPCCWAALRNAGGPRHVAQAIV